MHAIHFPPRQGYEATALGRKRGGKQKEKMSRLHFFLFFFFSIGRFIHSPQPYHTRTSLTASTIRYITVTNPGQQYVMIQEGRQARTIGRKGEKTPLDNRISKWRPKSISSLIPWKGKEKERKNCGIHTNQPPRRS